MFIILSLFLSQNYFTTVSRTTVSAAMLRVSYSYDVSARRQPAADKTVNQLTSLVAVVRLTSAADHSQDETKGVLTGDCVDLCLPSAAYR